MVWEIMENGMMNSDYVFLLWENIAQFLFTSVLLLGFSFFCLFFSMFGSFSILENQT